MEYKKLTIKTVHHLAEWIQALARSFHIMFLMFHY